MNNKPVHIALDFDKTLAIHMSEWGVSKVGRAIQPMIENVKKWLEKGYKVTIFTARLSDEYSTWVKQEQKRLIEGFLAQHGLPMLDITANKSTTFSHIIDDRAYHVQKNTGAFCEECAKNFSDSLLSE